MQDKSSELPKGWAWTKIDEIISPAKNAIKRGPFGSAIKKAFFVEKGFKVYEQGNAIYNDFRRGNYYISKEKLEELAGFEVKPGEFIISCSGTIGKIAIVPDNAERGIINQALLKIATDPRLISPKYFLNLFRSEGFQKKILGGTRGVAITNINSVKDLKTIAFALPPLPEQQRIVAKIEELFTKLDAGVEALKKVKTQLKRYRQAVLKYAFEGKLTQEWREANKDKLEPASALLKRIREERKKKVEGELKELPPVDIADLPELPEEWTWCRFGDVIVNISLIGKKLKQSEYQEKGRLPVIDQGQSFIGGYTDKDKLKIKVEKPLIIFGDHTKVFKYVDVDFVAGADGIKVLKPEEFYNPKLFYYFAQEISLPEKGYARHFQWLEKSLIPLPPIYEQLKIKDEIERRLSTSKEMEKVVEKTLKQSERLRQSILKTAFEGKLVPQDPTDEPAERLLERIKNEKMNQAKVTQKRFNRRKRYEQKT